MQLDGDELPVGMASTIHGDFKTVVLDQIGAGIADLFPKAVCFTIGELQAFLTEANAKLKARGIPFNERGIAIVFAICSSPKPHIRGKVTAMLVSTQFTEDALTGEVTSIDNPVTRRQPGNNDSQIDDYAYDTGSMWP